MRIRLELGGTVLEVEDRNRDEAMDQLRELLLELHPSYARVYLKRKNFKPVVVQSPEEQEA